MSAMMSEIGQDSPLVCLSGLENPNRLASLWWVMHRSHDRTRLASVVTLYLDESATEDSAPVAAVGGVLLNASGFDAMDGEWLEILRKHNVDPPLHMKDFRRPDGRLADVTNATRLLLFSDVTELINRCKIHSIAATLTTADYRKHFSKDFRQTKLGLYGACFILCAHLNHLLAARENYPHRIPFLLDSGNPYAEHVREAHSEMQKDHWIELKAGSLTFDDDKLWSPLQAADVIAWASRVQEQSGTFSNGYEPLAGLFDEAHEQHAFPESALAELAAKVFRLWL